MYKVVGQEWDPVMIKNAWCTISKNKKNQDLALPFMAKRRISMGIKNMLHYLKLHYYTSLFGSASLWQNKSGRFAKKKFALGAQIPDGMTTWMKSPRIFDGLEIKIFQLFKNELDYSCLARIAKLRIHLSDLTGLVPWMEASEGEVSLTAPSGVTS